MIFGRATRFEFRYRFWLIGAIFGAGFWMYQFDHQNVAVAIVRAILGSDVHLNSGWGKMVLQLAFAAGGALIVVAALLRTWATSYLRSEVVHDLDLHSEGLVADGPYRYTRNPLYLGSLLMTIGLGLLASRIGFAVQVLAIIIFGYRLIAREEAELLASQGESFRAYCAAVPRFFPALTPQAPAGNREPHWLQGLFGEAIFWCFAAAVFAFAITLNTHYVYAIIWTTLALYTIAMTIWKRNTRQSQSRS